MQIWEVATAYLFFKMWANSLIQAVSVIKYKKVFLPEDARFMKGKTHVSGEEPDLGKRASYCWENDLENIPVFLFLLLAFSLADGNSAWCMGFAIAFCASRTLHSFCMIKGIQPWRNICYQIGVFTCIGLSLGILKSVFFE
jgi:glutathione S-transferase